MPNMPVPTINDLRMKMCYICREEERFDHPEDPPKAWTHPCSCTLVAHESCLLQWIQTSQQTPSRSQNALKCPQCGTTYKLESNNPLALRLLKAGNRALLIAGQGIMVTSLGIIALSFGTGIYVLSTAYGAYALQEFLGREVYDLLLTDDPSNWPWHAFLNLPLIPISLIFSRFEFSSSVIPTFPLLLAWPTSKPVESRQRLILQHWAGAENARLVTAPNLLSWPPSIATCGLFLFPLVRSLYRRWFSRFSHWVLDTRPTPRRPVRRFVWALNDDGLFRVVVNANIQNEGQPERQEARAGQQPQPQQEQQQEQQQQNNAEQLDNAAAVGEQTVRVSVGSLGRLIGGALALPAVSSFMGSILFRLSNRFSLLRRFLGVRPPLKDVPSPPLGAYSLPENWGSMNTLRQIGYAARLGFTVVWSGTSTWLECDPVWWRNTIGLGIFVAARDCVHLLYLWLAKRELESRKVVNRSFEGVDVKELDLIDAHRFAP